MDNPYILGFMAFFDIIGIVAFLTFIIISYLYYKSDKMSKDMKKDINERR